MKIISKKIINTIILYHALCILFEFGSLYFYIMHYIFNSDSNSDYYILIIYFYYFNEIFDGIIFIYFLKHDTYEPKNIYLTYKKAKKSFIYLFLVVEYGVV